MEEILRHTVPDGSPPERLDRYLTSRLPQTLSRTAVQRSIAAGAVTVDGRAAKAHRHLKPGERILASIAEIAQPSRGIELTPEPIPIRIVYEDPHLLVVDKPAGLVTHPAPGHWSGTLVNAVVWHLQQRQATGDRRQDGVRSESGQSILPRAGIASSALRRQDDVITRMPRSVSTVNRPQMSGVAFDSALPSSQVARFGSPGCAFR